MPIRKQKFKDEWLSKKDSQDCSIGEYLQPMQDDEYKAKCLWCGITFSIADGYNVVTKHSKSLNHLSAMRNVKSGQESLFNACSKALSVKEKQDMQMKSEIIWSIFIALKTSFNAASETSRDNGLFRMMFPNDINARILLVEKQKRLIYVISQALGPSLSENLYTILRQKYFTLCLDETNNSAGYKQLGFTAIYWCETLNRVRTEYLTSIYMKINREDVINALAGKSNPPKLCSAEILNQEILTFLEAAHISPKNVFAINQDGRNVMVAMVRLFCKTNPNLIDFGTCKLHILHNSIQQAISKLSFDVVEFAMDMKYFLKHQALRLEELAALQDELDLDELDPLSYITVILQSCSVIKRCPKGLFCSLFAKEKHVWSSIEWSFS